MAFTNAQETAYLSKLDIESRVAHTTVPTRSDVLSGMCKSFLVCRSHGNGEFKGTNAGIYSFIAALGYARAVMLGEEMEVAKDNRGRGEKA